MIELTYPPFGSGNVLPPMISATDPFCGTTSGGMLVGGVESSFDAKIGASGDSAALIASRSACCAPCSASV